MFFKSACGMNLSVFPAAAPKTRRAETGNAAAPAPTASARLKLRLESIARPPLFADIGGKLPLQIEAGDQSVARRPERAIPAIIVLVSREARRARPRRRRGRRPRPQSRPPAGRAA